MAGHAGGVCTLPIHKKALKDGAGFDYFQNERQFEEDPNAGLPDRFELTLDGALDLELVGPDRHLEGPRRQTQGEAASEPSPAESSPDRKSDVQGKRVDLGGRNIIKK